MNKKVFITIIAFICIVGLVGFFVVKNNNSILSSINEPIQIINSTEQDNTSGINTISGATSDGTGIIATINMTGNIDTGVINSSDRSYEAYESLIEKEVLQETYNHIQAQKAIDIVKEYEQELKTRIKAGDMHLIKKIKVGDNTIAIYGGIQKFSSGGEKDTCGGQIVNGPSPGYPFCIGIIETPQGVIKLQVMTKDWFMTKEDAMKRKNPDQVFITLSKDNIKAINDMVILEEHNGDGCGVGNRYMMFDQNMEKRGEISIGGTAGCDGGIDMSITKILYKDRKIRKGSIGWSLRTSSDYSDVQDLIRTVTINQTKNTILPTLQKMTQKTDELANININNNGIVTVTIGGKKYTAELIEENIVNSDKYIGIYTVLTSPGGDGSYQLQGTIQGNQEIVDSIKKVTIESCNSKQSKNTLDGKPYTINSLKKTEDNKNHRFTYNIAPQWDNICSSPYVVRAYDTDGNLIKESVFDLLLPQKCTKDNEYRSCRKAK